MSATFREQLVYTNDYKIRFCNAFHSLERHIYTCTQCSEYLRNGDGDLCERGKNIIKIGMCLSDE